MRAKLLAMVDKAALYSRLDRQVDSVLDGPIDAVAAMATFVCIVHESLAQSSWTGFYRVVAPELLRVGPYQGPLGCLEIPFDRGVCGAVARARTTQIVDDVHAFAGHIACDANARSEIVVPVFGANGELAAVLDIDSREPAAFDEADRAGLERLVERLRQHL